MINIEDKMRELDLSLTKILEEKLFQIKAELLAVVEAELVKLNESASEEAVDDNKSSEELISLDAQSDLVLDESPKKTFTSQDELNEIVLSYAQKERIGLGDETVLKWLGHRISSENDIDQMSSNLLMNMIETVIEDLPQESIQRVLDSVADAADPMETIIDVAMRFLITQALK